MSILTAIKEHAAVASGDFAAMIRDAELPPLPAAVAGLVAEINGAEPDVGRLEGLIGAEPALAAKILRTINSPLYGLRTQVTSLRHAVTLLGLDRVRNLTLGYAVLENLPRIDDPVFDQDAFTSDALLRAVLARELSGRCGRGDPDQAYTGMLIADIAIPLLLASCAKHYAPLVAHWRERSERLSALEARHFGWNHAQAAAWALQNWELPDELVCLAASHDLPLTEIRELGLAETAAVTIATAALLPSVMKPQSERCRALVAQARAELGLDMDTWRSIGQAMAIGYQTTAGQFGLNVERAWTILELVKDANQSSAMP